MTEEEFNRLFPSGEPEQPAVPNAQRPAQPQGQEQGLEFDPQATAQLLGSLVEQPSSETAQPSAQQAPSLTPEQIQQARSSGILGAISDAISPPDVVDAFSSGGMRAVFETKDFLFGDTPPEEQSSVRRGIELQNDQLFVGGVAQSLIPFSAATRQLSQDSYMRDARTVTDKMLQVVPGMSETLPPKFNWLGQPILNRQGLWSDDNGTLVDIETVRLGLEGSSVMGPPSYTMGFKGSEIDLRDITLTTGENAYTKLQELSGKPGPNAKPLRDVIARIIASPAYQRAPDGSMETPYTRAAMLAKQVNKYRRAAANRIRRDANVREGLSKAQRKVKDHFAHLKAEPTEEQKGGLQAVLEAFGAGD